MNTEREEASEAGESWPLLYEDEIRSVLHRLDDLLLTTVIRGVRGSGKTTVLRELSRRLDGIFIQGRDPGRAVELMEQARTERKGLFIDDLDYLLDPDRERVGGEEGLTPETLEDIARNAVDTLRSQRQGVAVSYMYSSRRHQREYSDFISNLWQIGEKEYLPTPWSRRWTERVAKLLENPRAELTRRHGESKHFALFIGGLRVHVDQKLFPRIWRDEVIALTGRHPTLVAAALRALTREVEVLGQDGEAEQDPPDATKNARAAEVSTLVRQWLELTLSGEPLASIRLRIAALRKAEPVAFEKLVRASQSGGSLVLPLEGISDIRDPLEHEGLAYYDVRKGCLFVLGEAIRSELANAYGAAMSQLVPDEHRPEERGTLILAPARGGREIRLSEQPWQVLKLLYERGGTAVPASQLEKAIGAKNPAVVRAVIQRLSDRLQKAGIPDVIENRRGIGYYLVMSKLSG